MLGKIKKQILESKLFHTVYQIKDILIDDYIQRHLFNNPKYSDDKRLNKYEFQVYSQNGEDGIIEEIFNRIGTTNKFFVEFGVQNGLECNSTYLLLKEWSGLWMEGDPTNASDAMRIFQKLVQQGTLTIGKEFITAENIEDLFSKYSVPSELDFLSIDIDCNDWHVWKAINKYKPRVIAIEYNSTVRPNLAWVKSYKADQVWDGTNFFNASLKSMELLGNEKGYKLVGCNFAGCNAFFVREDLVNDNFFQPYTAENHFEPARYFLVRSNGHKNGFGDSFLLK